MDGPLAWSNQHHQSGTLMPSGAVHTIIASEAKQSIAPRVWSWIASVAALLAMTRAVHRSSGGIFLIRAECAAMSSRSKDRRTRLADGGCLSTDTPGRHSLAGPIGRRAKTPPQIRQS